VGAVLVLATGCGGPRTAPVPAAPERNDEPAEALRFYARKRAPAGQTAVPTERYFAAQQKMKAMRRFSTRLGRYLSRRKTQAGVAAGLLGTWSPLGPGNVGGRTRALVIDPTSVAVMYAAGVSGGVWKTTNAGVSWTPLADTMANLAVTTLAMDPTNSNVLYAGTGEGFFNIDAVRGAGIFKTTDGGVTWTRLTTTATPQFYYVNDIVISPQNSQRVYAAVRFDPPGGGGRVFRSTDGGANWTSILTPTQTTGCQDLAIRKGATTEDVLFAACGNLQQASVYRNLNADTGTVWTTVLNDSGMGRTSLAIAPSNTQTMYALTAEFQAGPFQDSLHAVFRSTDGGANWTKRVDNTSPAPLNRFLLSNPPFAAGCFPPPQIFGQGWYDNVLAVDPLDENRVWAGGIDLFRSDDGAANWGLASYWWVSPADTHYAHADQHAIVFHPNYDGASNKQMFVGNDGGLFRTLDARAATGVGAGAPCSTTASSVAWAELNNGYAVTQFYYGVPYPGGATYFGGTQDNGTVRGTNAGGPDGWTTIWGGDGGAVAVDPTNTLVLYAENTGLSIQKSVNGGGSFAAATSGITDLNFLFIAPFVMDPAVGGNQRLWTGGTALWRTTNAAASWVQASTNPVGGAGQSVSAIAVAPSSGGQTLLGGLENGFIHRTTAGLTANNTTAWPGVQPAAGYLSGLAFHPTNASIAYATYSTFGVVHVWKTTNGGVSWADADGSGATGIPDIPCHSVLVDPFNTNRLYVGTDLGVFVSNDGGTTWAVENTGFANVVTEALAMDGQNLFAFTHGRGAWRVATAGAPTISIGDVSVGEGDSGSTSAVFAVSLSSASGVQITVDYATANNTATAGLDYTATSGTVTFPPGAVSRTVTVPVLGDMTDEFDETFFVNLSNASVVATIADSQGLGTILDDDAEPTLRISDASIGEGNSGTTTMSFTVSLSAASGKPISVDYATADFTAVAPSDYVAAAGLLNIPAATLSVPLSVTVRGDTLDEGDETFLIDLANPVNATIADGQGMGTIQNDDGVPNDDVRFLTATSTANRNLLQWLKPGPPYVSTVIHRTTAAPNCVFETNPNNLATRIGEVFGLPSERGELDDPGRVNDTTYCYTAFVKTSAVPTFSAGRFVRGRPFDTGGSVKWSYTTGATSLAAPGVGGVAAYAVSNDRVLHAMTRGTGVAGGTWPDGPPAWTPFAMNAPAQSRPPVVPTAAAPGASQVVFLGSQDGHAYAVNADTGLLLWPTPTKLGDMVQAALVGQFTSFGRPYNLVMVGSRTSGADNTFYGLNPSDGSTAWSYAGEAGDPIGVINGAAAVDAAASRVYFASRRRAAGTSTLWCLDYLPGGATLRWRKALGDIDGSPVLRSGVVYVGDNAGVVHAFRADDGTPIWSFPTGTDGPVKGFIFPDRSSGDLYFTTNTKVWGLKGDGTRKWTEVTTIPGPSITLHQNGTGFVYVGSTNGRLYQIDDSSAGFPGPPPGVKSVPLGDGTASVGSPTLDVFNNLIYVGTEAGIVYAVEVPLP
jgi:outer membrane protein assembly factor BamB